MQNNISSEIRPLIWKHDKRWLIPLNEIAKELGLPVRNLRRYALNPKNHLQAVQFGPHQKWYFERDKLNAWWEKFTK